MEAESNQKCSFSFVRTQIDFLLLCSSTYLLSTAATSPFSELMFQSKQAVFPEIWQKVTEQKAKRKRKHEKIRMRTQSEEKQERTKENKRPDRVLCGTCLSAFRKSRRPLPGLHGRPAG